MSKKVDKFWEAWGRSNSLYTSWAATQKENSGTLFVLYALDRRDGVTQKTVAERTGLAKQTVNNIVRALKSRGFVELCAANGDRREKMIVLTPTGRERSQELLAPLYKLEERVFDVMGAKRVHEMIDSITLFNTVFEKELEKEAKSDAR